MVTITHNRCYFTDCSDVAIFLGPTNSADPLTDVSKTILHGDWFTIEGTPDSAADEYVYYTGNLQSFDSDIYTKYLLRWKTSASGNALGARAKITFTSGEQWILGESAPQFSTTFKVATGTITAGKTMTSLQVWADDYPDSVASGTSQVYFDFALLYPPVFTLPNVAGGMKLHLPPRKAFLAPPGRDVDITQHLGTKSAVVNISCDLDQGTWKRSGDMIDGEVFLDILHTRWPWQWLNTGSHQFKVTVEPTFRWVNNGDGSTSRLLDLVFTEYSLSDKSNETYAERFGIGL